MRTQIRTLEVPINRGGAGAFMPIPAGSKTAEFNGQNLVTGAPGTVPVYSPRPEGLNDGELGGPYNQPSSVSPNYILPSIYVAHANTTMKFPGNTEIAAVSPYPATAIGAVVQNGWKQIRIGGQTVTRAIRPFTTWPTYGS